MQSLVEGLLHGLKLLSQLREEQGPAPASIDDAAGQTLTKQVLEGQLVVVLRRHRRPHVDERQQEGVQGRSIEKVPFKSDKTSDTQQPATDGQLATEQTVYYFL